MHFLGQVRVEQFINTSWAREKGKERNSGTQRDKHILDEADKDYTEPLFLLSDFFRLLDRHFSLRKKFPTKSYSTM